MAALARCVQAGRTKLVLQRNCSESHEQGDPVLQTDEQGDPVLQKGEKWPLQLEEKLPYQTGEWTRAWKTSSQLRASADAAASKILSGETSAFRLGIVNPRGLQGTAEESQTFELQILYTGTKEKTVMSHPALLGWLLALEP